MKFFHGTSKENWKKIQKEGVLWGGDTWHKTGGKEGYRYTYLTPDVKIAIGHVLFGNKNAILEVEYEPVGNKVKPVMDNYGFDPPLGLYCWQFSVFVPIGIRNVRLISEKELNERVCDCKPSLPKEEKFTCFDCIERSRISRIKSPFGFLAV